MTGSFTSFWCNDSYLQWIHNISRWIRLYKTHTKGYSKVKWNWDKDPFWDCLLTLAGVWTHGPSGPLCHAAYFAAFVLCCVCLGFLAGWILALYSFYMPVSKSILPHLPLSQIFFATILKHYFKPLVLIFIW